MMLQELLEMAKKRLRTFSHVGTTEQLLPSIESCAASLGMRLDGPAYAGGEVGARQAEAKGASVSMWRQGARVCSEMRMVVARN